MQNGNWICPVYRLAWYLVHLSYLIPCFVFFSLLVTGIQLYNKTYLCAWMKCVHDDIWLTKVRKGIHKCRSRLCNLYYEACTHYTRAKSRWNWRALCWGLPAVLMVGTRHLLPRITFIKYYHSSYLSQNIVQSVCDGYRSSRPTIWWTKRSGTLLCLSKYHPIILIVIHLYRIAYSQMPTAAMNLG